MKGLYLNDDEINVFTGMFSLLDPDRCTDEISASLQLPTLNNFFQPLVSMKSTMKPSKSDLLKKNKKKHKKLMRVTACPHVNKKHYARGMCNMCYHRYGREFFEWNCRRSRKALSQLKINVH
ncbi:unnamed protein product [Blepharisma stoltei]|uniref:Uncharacterized protein n=1 Tax=Blepharisma stoltei TaxID=1481888 RepID=A0AAU9K6C9_9CILI|nr:unnamed protein product [Blepharisma stoltei]